MRSIVGVVSFKKSSVPFTTTLDIPQTEAGAHRQNRVIPPSRCPGNLLDWITYSFRLAWPRTVCLSSRLSAKR